MQIALQHPRFGRLLAALAASQLGDWLYNLALLAYVQERTHSTTWLGLTTAARIAPMVAGGPVGGLIADRFDRRRTMIVSDVVRAASMGALWLSAVAGGPIILIPALAAATTLAGIAYPPCVAAMTPRLVPAARLAAANAARGVIAPTCVAAGPALGAGLLLLGTPATAFAVNATTFAISGLLVASIPADAELAGEPRTPGSETGAELAHVLAELRAGLRTLIAAPEAIWMVGADILGSVVYGTQTVMLLLVAGRVGLHTRGYGYLLAALGLGGILGAIAAGRLGTRAGGARNASSGRPTVLLGLSMVALPLPLLALTQSAYIAVVLAIALGAGALLIEVTADTSLQRNLEESRLGCAYGFAFAASVGGIAAGALLAPMLVALVGITGGMCTIAVAVLTLAAAFAIRTREHAARRPVVDERSVVLGGL